MTAGPDGVAAGRREPLARRSRLRGAAPVAAVAAGYVVFAVVVMWPLARSLGEGMFLGGDAGSFMWGFWWMRDSLASLRFPFSSDHIFAPVGTPLVYHTYMPLLGAVSTPLQLLFGVTTAYNLVVLLTPVASALAMYWLARDLRLHRPAAFVAGTAYGFAPAMVDRIAVEHLNLGFVAWLPLSVLALRAALRRPDRRGPAILLALSLGGALYTDLTVWLLGVLVLAAYGVGWLWCRRRQLVSAARTAVAALWPAAVAFALLAAPFVALMVRATLAGDSLGLHGVGGARIFSADVVSFVAPSPRHPLGDLLAGLYSLADGLPRDGAGYVGYVALAAGVTGAVWCSRRGIARWAVLLVVAGLVTALGPEAHIAGRTVTPLPIPAPDGDGVMSALLPFTWLRSLPLMEGLRAPARFLTIVAFGLAVLAGLAVEAARGRSRVVGGGLAVVLSLLLVLDARTEFHSFDVLPRPAVYDQVAADPADGILVNVPLGFRSGGNLHGTQEGPVLVWATHHRKPVAVGFGSRTATWRLDGLAEDFPFYRDLLALQRLDVPPELSADPRQRHPGSVEEGRRSAAELGVRWVVVRGEQPEVDAYLREVGFAPAAADGDVVLYVSGPSP